MSSDEGTTRRRFTPRRLAVVVALLLVVAVLAGGWIWSAASAGRVEVSWTPTCEGTKVSRYTPDGRSPSPIDDRLEGQYVVDARPGSRCTLAVKVHNGSRSSVHLTALNGDFLGKGGGAEVMGLTSKDLTRLDRGDGTSGVDAHYPLDRHLAAGATVTLDLVVGWRESGCNGDGHVYFGGFPSMELSVAGLHHEVASDQYFVLSTHDGDHEARPGTNC